MACKRLGTTFFTYDFVCAELKGCECFKAVQRLPCTRTALKNKDLSVLSVADLCHWCVDGVAAVWIYNLRKFKTWDKCMVDNSSEYFFSSKRNPFVTSKLDCCFSSFSFFSSPSASAAHALILMDSIMIDILGLDLEVLAMKAYQCFPRREMEKR